MAGSNCETVTGTLDDQAIDFKFMVHAIHAGARAGYKVCGFGNTGYDFSGVVYPGKLNNCEGCHLADTYYPPDSSTALATTIDAGDRTTPLRGRGDHSGGGGLLSVPRRPGREAAHAVERLVQRGEGRRQRDLRAVETCAACHGPGKSVDVKVVHGVGSSNNN